MFYFYTIKVFFCPPSKTGITPLIRRIKYPIPSPFNPTYQPLPSFPTTSPGDHQTEKWRTPTKSNPLSATMAPAWSRHVSVYNNLSL